MKAIKILISILIMSILIMAVVTSAKDTVVLINASENIENPTSDTPVAEIEEAKLPSIDEEKDRLEKRMRYGEILINQNKTNKTNINTINAINTIPSGIKYTNPITGISIFGVTFEEISIYIPDVSTWHNYSFYLPIASYVDISYNADVYSFVDSLGYTMYVDSDYLTGGDSYGDCEIDLYYCDIEIQMSRSTYLGKGWHTIYISGQTTPARIHGYRVYGRSLTIIAFPEYTAITVTSPNGYENWYRGQTKSITWAKYGQPGANVKIELYKSGVLSSVISSLTPDDGIYSWYIPTYLPIGTEYKIKITSTSDSKYNDWSNNNFKIY